ncbi:hypothetical protein H8D57_00515, partial [bacterium]|nr:hypothetical protein [bacterium]
KIDPRPDVFEEIDIQAFIDEISDLLIQIDVKRKEITQVADHFRTKAKESVKQDTKTVKTKQTDPFVPPEGKKSDEEKDDDIIEKKDKPSETLEEDKKAKPKKRSPRKAKRTTSTKTQKPGISDKKI